MATTGRKRQGTDSPLELSVAGLADALMSAQRNRFGLPASRTVRTLLFRATKVA